MNEPELPRVEFGVYPPEYVGEKVVEPVLFPAPVPDNLCCRSSRSCCTRSLLSAAVITPGSFLGSAPEVDFELESLDQCLFSRVMISPRRSSVSRPSCAAEAEAPPSPALFFDPALSLGKLSIARSSSHSLMSASICVGG